MAPVIIVHLQLVHVGQVVDRVARDLAEDGVLLIQTVRAVQGDEELAPIRVRRVGIGACHQAPAHGSEMVVTQTEPHMRNVVSAQTTNRNRDTSMRVRLSCRRSKQSVATALLQARTLGPTQMQSPWRAEPMDGYYVGYCILAGSDQPR